MVVIQLLIAALLYAASFKPVGLWIAAPLAYALLLHILRKQRYTSILAPAFAFISNLLILHWSGTYVGAVPWILLALLQSLYYLPLGMLAARTRNIPLLIALILIIDEVKARFPFGGFGWTRIGFSQVDSPFINIVALGGVASISAVTLLIAWAALERRSKVMITLFLILLLAPFLTAPSTQDQVLKVRAIQAGVVSPGVDFNARAFEVLKLNIDESLKSITAGDQLVVWPENAIDIDPIRNSRARELLAQYIADSGKPLIAGAVIERNGLKNATLFYSAEGDLISIYEKRFLTPFGEFIPLRKLASLVSPYVKDVTDFSPGRELLVHNVQGLRISSVICYEILSDSLLREAAADSGAIVVHTNSATFYGTSEGEQQLAITRIRAIEHGRSIVSVSTTGPSAIIDHRGVVLSKLRDGDRGSLAYSLPFSNYQTFSDKFGTTVPVAIIIGFLILGIYRRRSWQ